MTDNTGATAPFSLPEPIGWVVQGPTKYEFTEHKAMAEHWVMTGRNPQPVFANLDLITTVRELFAKADDMGLIVGAGYFPGAKEGPVVGRIRKMVGL